MFEFSTSVAVAPGIYQTGKPLPKSAEVRQSGITTVRGVQGTGFRVPIGIELTTLADLQINGTLPLRTGEPSEGTGRRPIVSMASAMVAELPTRLNFVRRVLGARPGVERDTLIRKLLLPYVIMSEIEHGATKTLIANRGYHLLWEKVDGGEWYSSFGCIAGADTLEYVYGDRDSEKWKQAKAWAALERLALPRVIERLKPTHWN